MENKQPTKRVQTRMEKANAGPKQTFSQLFKRTLFSKTTLGASGLAVVAIFGYTVARPEYQLYKLRKAEEMADLLWEKDYKNSSK